MFVKDAVLGPNGVIFSSPPEKYECSTPMVRKKQSRPKNIYTEEDYPVYSAGVYYGQRYQEYFAFRRKFFKAGPTKDLKCWRYFTYVVHQAKEMGITAENFIEAQIWWFNKNRKCFPSPWDLTPLRSGAATPERIAQMWKESFGGCLDYYVKPAFKNSPTACADEDKFYKSLLKNTAKQFDLSPDEVIQLFGSELFSEEFLKSQTGK